MRFSPMSASATLLLFLAGCGDTSWLEDVRNRERDRAADASQPRADSSEEFDAEDIGALATDVGAVDTTVVTEVGADLGSGGDGSRGEVAVDVTEVPADQVTVDGEVGGCSASDIPSGAIFVSPGSTGDGSAARPLGTIAAAVVLAQATAAKTVVLSGGVYAESVTLNASVTIAGGYRFGAGGWVHLCEASAADRPTIRSPGAIGVQVTGGAVSLQHLEITTADGGKLASGDGESTYGVVATGNGTVLSLMDVIVAAGKGGDGAPAEGVLAATPNSCTGLGADCPTEAAGSEGPAGGPGDNGKLKFSAEGYVPEAPKDGVVGTPGKNGRPGTAGTRDSSCVTGCAIANPTTCKCQESTGTKAGSDGTCGCGGTGGNAGRAGHNGGASVGVFVGAGAGLAIKQADLSARRGGAGTKGTDGVDGKDGSQGVAGVGQECFGNCNAPSMCTASAVCTFAGVRTLSGGSAGGSGGRGGKGGAGGAGLGGPSHALVTQGSTTVVGLESAQLSAALGGAGGANGLDGAAKAYLVVQ